MRGKRSKQYRKLMQQYSLTFGFRPPYQVLIDSQMIQDAEAFKMDLVGGLERALGDKVKPMITQCSIRHLYTLKDLPQEIKDTLIATAKTMERRRCNHHTLEEPLSTLDCLQSVIDPKESRTNKNRYVIASQDETVRRTCRDIKGVPLVYVRRSVMILEPMAESSIGAREALNRSKFKSGLRRKENSVLGKRKDREGSHDMKMEETGKANGAVQAAEKVGVRSRTRGPKGPNPLAVKKPKRVSKEVQREPVEEAVPDGFAVAQDKRESDAALSEQDIGIIEGVSDDDLGVPSKRKRKRKHKSKALGKIIDSIDIDNEASE